MISADGASFRYAASDAPALQDFNLRLVPGEFVVLAGPSGCGKTTATRLFNGLIPHFFPGALTGQVSVFGAAPAAQPMWATAGKVGSVFQNPRSQFFTTDPVSEVAFGCENLGFAVADTQARVAQALREFDFAALAGRSIFALSGGEKQRLACAAAAAAGPRLMVLDEPSANLDRHATAQLAAAMGRWKARGVTVLVAEHRLDYLRHLVDRVVVMDAGRVTAELGGVQFRALPAAAVRGLGLRAGEGAGSDTAGRAAPAGTGVLVRDFRYRYPQHPAPGSERPAAAGEIRFDELRFPAGSITALTGPNGVGKSTLLRWMAGLTRARSGQLWLAGEVLPRRRRRRSTFLVLQDVNHQLVTESVADEIEVSLRIAGVRGEQAAARHDEILRRMDLRDVAQAHPLALSGGQKQRLAIVTALASDRPIVALDEPTSGLDLRHMEEVAAALRELAAAGRTVVVATHDQELIAACADGVVELS